tara:strand:- start:1208 stop:2230 length:1023 start_codon:yes stop_codon:yes gene_type:complete
MGLGTSVLGYNDSFVNKKVHDQIDEGTLFSLPSVLEVKMAEELNKLIPSAQSIRFYKNGADICSLAVRLARSYTKKKHVLFSGYHGHHEWYSFTLRDSGNIQEMKNYSHKIPFNSFSEIKSKVEELKNDVSIIILEIDFFRPKKGYLNKLKKYCTKNNIVLAFDEMWTGFRFPGFSFQKYIKVTPNISLFSKGISNGYTLAAIVGDKKILNEFNNIWGYTTFGSDALSLKAGLSTIQRIKKVSAIDHIWKLGNYMIDKLKVLLRKNNLQNQIKIIGYPCRFKLHFIENKNETKIIYKIKETLIKNNILWNNMFVISYSHKKYHIKKTLKAFDESFNKLNQ